MTDRELLQQALDMLDDINQCSLPPTGIPLPAEIDHVMEALRARLAQPEPVIQARKEGDLIVADLPQVPTGGGGISKDEQPEPILPGGGIGRHPDIPTKLFGPNLEGILNAAGFVRKKEWVGLTDEERNASINTWVRELVFELEVMLRDKNT
jgi:hypothetical protein